MSFAAPGMLVGLLLLPIAVWAYVSFERRLRRGRAAFSSPAVVRSVAPKRPGWRRHAPPVLYALALAALIVAIARPQATVAVPVHQGTVILATDHSGSMQAKDVAPTRLQAARQAADRFLAQVPNGIAVGVVAFNDKARLVQSATPDLDRVRAALDRIVPSGGTATGDAIEVALRAARQSARRGAKPPPAAILLLSDGHSVRGVDPLTAARDARRAHIPIYTIALGTQSGRIPVPGTNGARTQLVPPDPQALQQIAQISGGRGYTAEDTAQLKGIYQRLGAQVAHKHEKREVTAAAAGGALLFVLGAAAMSLAWFGRLL
jgi:Ca-activated chloride channel family protein